MTDESNHSSFAVALTPEFDEQGKWTGAVSATLEEDVRNDLDADELTQIRSVCGMMAACLPLMEEDEDFLEHIKAYFYANYTQLIDEILDDAEEQAKPSFVRSKDGKVITLDFNTKTHGSA